MMVTISPTCCLLLLQLLINVEEEENEACNDVGYLLSNLLIVAAFPNVEEKEKNGEQ